MLCEYSKRWLFYVSIYLFKSNYKRPFCFGMTVTDEEDVISVRSKTSISCQFVNGEKRNKTFSTTESSLTIPAL